MHRHVLPNAPEGSPQRTLMGSSRASRIKHRCGLDSTSGQSTSTTPEPLSYRVPSFIALGERSSSATRMKEMNADKKWAGGMGSIWG